MWESERGREGVHRHKITFGEVWKWCHIGLATLQDYFGNFSQIIHFVLFCFILSLLFCFSHLFCAILFSTISINSSIPGVGGNLFVFILIYTMFQWWAFYGDLASFQHHQGSIFCASATSWDLYGATCGMASFAEAPRLLHVFKRTG